jgi:two-component system chemotaxis sensor kinase CheA
MESFEKELRLSFLEEAKQLLNEVEQCYLQLEINPSDSSLIDQIFRVAHNIKGSARAVGFTEVGGFAHEFENLLLKIKNTEMEATQPVIDLLLKCNDHLTQMVYTLKDDLYATFNSQYLLEQIAEALSGQLSEIPSTIEDVPNQNSFEEISTALDTQYDSIKLQTSDSIESTENQVHTEANHDFYRFSKPEDTEDTLDLDSESGTKEESTNSVSPSPIKETTPRKPITEKHTQPRPQSQNSKNQSATGSAASDESIRVSLTRLEKLLNYVGEMVILHAVLKEQTIGSSLLIRKTVHQLGKATKEVQDISMGLRMVPVRQTFQKMQRIVRDTTGDLGKKVKLILEGEDTELDKTILERISDPLVHLVRNACDHGIESPAKRIVAGKDETGVLKLSAYHQSGKLIIKISDDGGGINAEVLRRKAIEKKIITPTTQLSEKEAINLIFHPGFSTKTEVTDVSGRGVGMDVVKNNIEAIQGEVLIDTEVGRGTTFKILLPLTLAIIDAMVVKLNDLRYVIPLSHIQESVKLENRDIKKTSGLGDILLLRGDNIPLFYLTDLLTRKSALRNESAQYIALVIKSSHETFAIVVDDIIGQYQIVIKKLGNEIHGLKGVSGSAILGDGRPALILELAELVSKSKKAFNNDVRGVSA